MNALSDPDFNLRQELLNLDIADLDDEEYEIPPVEKTPTLESILNSDDTSLLSEDELSSYLSRELGLEEGGETASLSSVGSRKDGHSPRHRSSGCILRHVILKAVSAQLRSASDRVNAGKPTVMAVTTMVSVGTSQGFILMFDSTQTLKWCYEGDQEQGAVSCLALNVDCTRLLAGFARGLLLMLDTADGKVLRTMVDVHTPSTAVLHVKFTDNPTLAVVSDSGGSVFELSFRRTLGVRGVDSKCLFSGSRGEVVTIEPLLLHQLTSHPLHGSVLIAMATLSKVIIVSIRPSTRLLLTHSVKASPVSLPLLSWQFVIIQVADTQRIMDPVLAFARDTTIYFYQVSVEASGRIACVTLQQLNLGYSLLACHWLNARSLALIDASEALHLVDVRSREQLETLDLAGVGLVYNTSSFKGLATGGNVSKALALAGERACYNTVQSFGNQILLLGTRSFHVISIRTWIERVNHFVDQNRYGEALKLGMEFLEEKGKAVLGLRGPRKHRHRIVREKVLDTLNTYVDKTLESGDSISYHEALPSIINHCVQLDQKELLFTKVWDGLYCDPGARAIYLQSLEAVVLEGKLSSVPPEIMQQLVKQLEQMEKWQVLERCVLAVDIVCIDIEQVLVLCRQHDLHDALISVWNRAMLDYTSPIHELVPLLQTLLDQGEVERGRCLGNRLLVYLSCCLSGRGYPHGDLPPSSVETVRQQVFKALCSQHTVNATDSEVCYPFLRILLQFDTREFLNALAIAFEDPQFSSQLRQRLVNILIQVMVEGEGFASTQVGWLFTFLASQLSRSHCVLRVDTKLFERVVAHLTAPGQDSTHSERQAAFSQLMAAGGLAHYTHQDLLALARSAEFYQVCATLHERRGEHRQVLKCYLLDNGRKHRVFNYIEQSSHKSDLQSAVLDNIDGLLDIDATETGHMVQRHFSQIIPDIVPLLSDKQLYLFLKGVLLEGELEPPLMTRYFVLTCHLDPELALPLVQANKNIQLDQAIQASTEQGLDEVTAVLLERSGDLQGAFDLLLNRLHSSMDKGEPLESQMQELVGLAHRGNNVMDPRKSWLPLLQCLLKLNSHEMLRQVLSNTDLNLASELHLLLEHTNGTLGQLRPLIMGLFEKCVHEKAMLRTTVQLQYQDLHSQLQKVLQDSRRGQLVPSSCSTCQYTLHSTLHLFRCGHIFHVDCLASPSHCNECYKPEVPG
ncbi:vacuolar protein sorting-associated protein 8 homolog isoform X2 [Homalodisca vitripennis]|nr:vacuolar protein sorting-associated protein 8 homolog isoform X1 [Homalodisca vitripennis]XP_046679914.1 vacuolar protein sorting-associated protein 8 homolog isoform X2 [Homalodisca vitripennis]